MARNNAVIAGPKMIPQNPKLVSPATMAKKMSISLIVMGVLMRVRLIKVIIRGLTPLSIRVAIMIIE